MFIDYCWLVLLFVVFGYVWFASLTVYVVFSAAVFGRVVVDSVDLIILWFEFGFCCFMVVLCDASCWFVVISGLCCLAILR